MNIDNLLFLDDFLTTIMGFNTNGKPNNNLRSKGLNKTKVQQIFTKYSTRTKIMRKKVNR